MKIVATGGNYFIGVQNGTVVCSVWVRPDVGREEGARFAQEKIQFSETLASQLGNTFFVLDLRKAPTSWGPSTHASLVKIVQAWEEAQKRSSILVGDEPLQRIMAREVVKEGATVHGRMCKTVAEVSSWAQGEVEGLLFEASSLVAEERPEEALV